MVRDGRTSSMSLEDFVTSITAQLDRVQDTLSLKARMGRPLTFALKDMSVDLQVFWEPTPAGPPRIRHAQPNETGASTVHLSFTTITREMVEENTVSLFDDDDPRALDDLDALDVREKERLDRLGVRTVGQLRRMTSGADPSTVHAHMGIPVLNLRAALEAASKPAVTGNRVERRGDRTTLRIRGANLGSEARVRLAGDPVEVLEATDTELVVEPLAHHVHGEVEVRVGEASAHSAFRIREREQDPWRAS